MRCRHENVKVLHAHLWCADCGALRMKPEVWKLSPYSNILTDTWISPIAMRSNARTRIPRNFEATERNKP